MAPGATKACQPSCLEQADGVAGVKRRGARSGSLDDLNEPKQAHGGEPGKHHRSEQPAHAGRAAALEEKKPKEHQDGKFGTT